MQLYPLRLLDLVLIFCFCISPRFPHFTNAEDSVLALLHSAAALHSNQDHAAALASYDRVLELDPSNPDALHLKGLIYHAEGDSKEAMKLITLALQNNPPSRSAIMHSNLGEIHRSLGSYGDAAVHHEAAISLLPSSPSVLYNYACLLLDVSPAESLPYFSSVIENPDSTPSQVLNSLKDSASILYHSGDFTTSFDLYTTANSLSKIPDIDILLGLGTSSQRLGLLDVSLSFYNTILSIEPNHENANMNIGVLMHETGDLKGAQNVYRYCLDSLNPNIHTRVTLMNNLGAALMSSNSPDEGAAVLEEALKLDPKNVNVLINLSMYYNEDGNLRRGRKMLDEALKFKFEETGRVDVGLKIRKAISLPPVMGDKDEVIKNYNKFQEQVANLALETINLDTSLKVIDPVQTIERIHFYLVYMGSKFDRVSQRLVNELYSNCIVSFDRADLVAPKDHSNSNSNSNNRLLSKPDDRKVKIGFVSKFFGDFEPHGLLLEGVIRHLPRSIFQVYILPISSSGETAKYLEDTYSEVVKLTLSYSSNLNKLADLALDIIVYADLNSEPMTHFMSLSRLAPCQVAFWGNPVTSGNQKIDYFISFDRGENPYRTLVDTEEEPYSEQVVLLEGLGIWYNDFSYLEKTYYENSIEMSNLKTWEDFATTKDAKSISNPNNNIYLCAQSVFKLSSDFDVVVNNVLRSDPDGVVVFTKGRRPAWTAKFKSRLRQTLSDELYSRVYFIERVGSIDFPNLIKLCTVLLHPFPFGGSRTSLDGLEAGVPIVTWPQNFLRGRMAVSYFAEMEIWDCCVAWSSDEYVEKVVRLGKDKSFRSKSIELIKSRIHRVYNNVKVVKEWTRFLCTVAGVESEDVNRAVESFGEDPSWQKEEHVDKAFSYMQSKSPIPEALPTAPSPTSYNILDSYYATAAVIHNNNGDLEKALDMLVKLSHERPTGSKVRSDIGAVLQQMRRLDESVAELEKAVMLDGENVVAMNNLGVVMKDKGEGSKALEWFIRAKEGGLMTAVDNAANIYRDEGNLFAAYKTICESLFQPNQHLCTGEEATNNFVGLVCVLGLVEDVLQFKNIIAREWGADVLTMLTDLVTNKDSSGKLTTGLLTFMSWNGFVNFEAVEEVYRVLKATPSQSTPSTENVNSHPVNLVVQFYRNFKSESKNVEALAALSANLRNPFLSRVHVMLERESDLSFLQSNLDVDADAISNSRLVIKVINQRLTFAAAFEYINSAITSHEVGLLSNSDIIFTPSSLEHLSTTGVPSNTLYALTRWEAGSNKMTLSNWRNHSTLLFHLNAAILHPRIDSQDSWAVMGGNSVPSSVIRYAGFWQGLPRCDGRIARIFEEGGWKVQNRCMDVRGVHVENFFGGEGGGEGTGKLGYDMEKNVVGETSFVKIMV
ncbi:hypothetical protein TrST_g2000 [Triparma strigata]|uniref:Protein O-GlcNAc transferase n=1 Tax=Triparma strigata TaxID=1606541 RepID=A0A9W7B895_9STRA|nr:hypothetical protein TrST_g2000 [Triparma strigata]